MNLDGVLFFCHFFLVCHEAIWGWTQWSQKETSPTGNLSWKLIPIETYLWLQNKLKETGQEIEEERVEHV